MVLPIRDSPTRFRSRQHNGEPAIFLSEEDEVRLAVPLQKTLIARFYRGCPATENISKYFQMQRFKDAIHFHRLRNNVFMFKCSAQEDFDKMRAKGSWFIDGFRLRVSKFTTENCQGIDSSVIPIWIALPGLPVYLFDKDFLFSIAGQIGDPIMLDNSTATISRPRCARVCIDFDMNNPMINRIWIQGKNHSFWQKIIFEKTPAFCFSCGKLGHMTADCRRHNKSSLPRMIAINQKLNAIEEKSYEDITKVQNTPGGVESLGSDSGKKNDELMIHFGDFVTSARGNEVKSSLASTSQMETKQLFNLVDSSSETPNIVNHAAELDGFSPSSAVDKQQSKESQEGILDSTLETLNIVNHIAELGVLSPGSAVEKQHSREPHKAIMESREFSTPSVKERGESTKNQVVGPLLTLDADVNKQEDTQSLFLSKPLQNMERNKAAPPSLVTSKELCPADVDYWPIQNQQWLPVQNRQYSRSKKKFEPN